MLEEQNEQIWTREKAEKEKICTENLQYLYTKREMKKDLNEIERLYNIKLNVYALIKNLLLTMFMPDGKDLHNLGQSLKSVQEK